MKKVPFLIDILATGFYMGKIPFMPGTFGSLVASFSISVKIILSIWQPSYLFIISKTDNELSSYQPSVAAIIFSDVALMFAELGVERLHIVDLNGARTGEIH